MLNTNKKLLILGLSLLLSACQMPSYNPVSSPSGPSGPSGSSIPPVSSGGSSDSSADQASPPSTSSGDSAGESIEDLDQELDRSLEGFDDSMGSSTESSGDIDILSPTGSSDIQSENTESTLESANGTEDDAVAEENDGLAERASSGMDGEIQADTQSNRDNTSSSQQGETTQSVPIPEDIGDGQGDNIVLRQIREAAMKERNPVLRDRLWDEYRKIKNQ